MASYWRITLPFPLLLWVLLLVSRTEAISIKCDVCEESRCPELHYCEGEAVKDHCGCCTVCSSSKYQPHPLIASVQRQGSACEQVECPKFKVCVENMQGLPLCTCPSQYICRRRKQRTVCGTDGRSYDSRCHLRIAACNSGLRIKVDRRGSCTDDGSDKGSEVKPARQCKVSASTCRRREPRMVCGTDLRTYASRCLMKVSACQQGVKIKVKSRGPCPSRSSTTDVSSSSSDYGDGDDDDDDDNDAVTHRDKRKRRRNKGDGNGSNADAAGSDDENRKKRRQLRRERRKQKKQEKRRKRRKTKGRGKTRNRRFNAKHLKDRFQQTFGHYTWRY